MLRIYFGVFIVPQKQSNPHFLSVETPTDVSADTQTSLSTYDEYLYSLNADWQSTPGSNTGSKYQTHKYETKFNNVSITYSVGVDWLQGVAQFRSTAAIKEVMNELASLVGDEILWTQNYPLVCGVFWENRVHSVFGITIAWNDSLDGNAKALIVLPGKFWSNLETKFPKKFMSHIFVVFSTLYAYDFKATRIDCRIDDYSKSITYEMLEDAAKKRNFALVKRSKPDRPISLDPDEDLGWTFYFGSYNSDKYIRFYDKNIESKGQIDAVRVEVQYRDERADAIFKNVCESLPNFMCDGITEDEYEVLASQYYASVVTGAISFVDRTSGDRLSRQSLLPWWENFTNAIAIGIRIPSAPVESSPEKYERWLYYLGRSVRRAAMLLGDKLHLFIDDIVKDAESRMTAADLAYVRVHSKTYNWVPRAA